MQATTLARGGSTLQAAIPVQVAWYASGVLLGFLVPFTFTSWLDINHDLYYGIYFAAVAVFLFAYVRSTGIDVVDLFRRHWQWSLALGIVASAVLVTAVIVREDSTARPDGAYFAFSLIWRGLTYGVVDALLLTAFPMVVAYRLFGGRLATNLRRAGFAALALLLVMVITATYHLGYEQFRDAGVRDPETGNVIISLPAILTANPLGSVVAHASMHIAADIHAYETEVYLPPQQFVDREPGAFPSEAQLTEADDGRDVELAVGGTLIVALASNPSTGYRWMVDDALPSQLRQEGDPRFVPPGSTQPVTGAPGTEIFTFTAVDKGDATLAMTYVSASGEADPERAFTVHLVIR